MVRATRQQIGVGPPDPNSWLAGSESDMRLQAAVRDLLLQSAVCYTRSGFGCFVICSPGPLLFLPCLSAGQRCNETIGNGTRLAAEWMAAPVDSVKRRLAKQIGFSEERHNGFLICILHEKERIGDRKKDPVFLVGCCWCLAAQHPSKRRTRSSAQTNPAARRGRGPNQEACRPLFASQGHQLNPTAWDVPHSTFQWSRCRPSVKRRGLARSL